MGCIMSGTTVAGFFVVREMHDEVSPVAPIISYIFVSYVVSRVYMNVFSLAVDTSLQCFLASEESETTGDFVPSELRDFVAKNIDRTRNETNEESKSKYADRTGDEAAVSPAKGRSSRIMSTALGTTQTTRRKFF